MLLHLLFGYCHVSHTIIQQYYVENGILLVFSGNAVIFRKAKFGTEKHLAKSARTYNTTDVNIKYKCVF